MADSVACGRKGQKTPHGFYNIERMLKRLIAAQARVVLCGTCLDGRGIAEKDLIEGVARSTIDEVAGESLAADEVLVF